MHVFLFGYANRSQKFNGMITNEELERPWNQDGFFALPKMRHTFYSKTANQMICCLFAEPYCNHLLSEFHVEGIVRTFSH